MRHSRFYTLNGKEIDSQKVDGFLHIAREDRGKCVACEEIVKKGQKRVRMNVFGCDEPMHFDCYVGDNEPEPTILGVKTEKKYRFGIKRTYVICEEFPKK